MRTNAREIHFEVYGDGASLSPDVNISQDEACTAAFVAGVTRIIKKLDGFALAGDTVIKDGIITSEQVRIATTGTIDNDFVLVADRNFKNNEIEYDSIRLGIIDKQRSDILAAEPSATQVLRTIDIIIKNAMISTIQNISVDKNGMQKIMNGEFFDWGRERFDSKYHGVEITDVEFSPKDGLCRVYMAYPLTVHSLQLPRERANEVFDRIKEK
jgi:hypothetical protein